MKIDPDLLRKWAGCFAAGLTEENPATEEARSRFWQTSEELYVAIIEEIKRKKKT